MKRVEAALKEGRCVVALSGRALSNEKVLFELRRRSLPVVALSGDADGSAKAISNDTLAPVLDKQGGVLVLVEPDGATEGRGLGELARLIKAGAHRPKLYVAARAFNPFSMPMDMRLMQLEQLKMRGSDFMAQLPLSSAAVDSPVSKKKRRQQEMAKIPAPRPVFVGREDESAALLERLDSPGGPILVRGPAGCGRRWLIEHCLAQRELERVPDFCFGRGTDHDSFMAVLAMLTKEAGDERLHDSIRQPGQRPPAHELAGMVVEALRSEALGAKVWIVDGLSSLLDRRDGSFYRDDALSAILRAILTAELQLKLIFIVREAPTFYREGEAANLRTVDVSGLKGKELHELFEAWQIPEFPRDRFGPIVERTHGHPMASRYFGVAIRNDGDVDALLKEPKFLKASALDDLEPMARHIKRRVGELDEDLRKKFGSLALFRTPVSAQALQILGLKRMERITLLSKGLLEQTPLQDDRRYYVHPLVAKHLSAREALDFENMKMLGEAMLEQSRGLKKDGKMTASIAMALDGNRLLSLSRNGRASMVLPYPDNDPVIENIREILRRKKPRLDIARMRLREASKADPRNPKLTQIEVELALLENKKDFDAASLWQQAEAHCPVPELFHAQATIASRKNQRGRAVSALETGVMSFPANARLRRRLASLQMSQNRLEEAKETLKVAQDLEPMMPDTYSQLAEVYMRLGVEHLEDAKASLDEALRLDPEGSQHHARLGEFHRVLAMTDSEKRAEHLQAAEACLREAHRIDPNHARIQVSLATVLLDSEGDLEQAQWLLKKATKRSETADGLIQQARLRIHQGGLGDVERLLERATKKEPSNHAAFSARAEFWMAQGQIFHAFEALKTARERSPKGCPERVMYELLMQKLGALIESGQAAELLKASESEASVEQQPESGGPRRDAGSTTRLRKAPTSSDDRNSNNEPQDSGDPESTELPAVEEAVDEHVQTSAEDPAPDLVAEEAEDVDPTKEEAASEEG